LAVRICSGGLSSFFIPQGSRVARFWRARQGPPVDRAAKEIARGSGSAAISITVAVPAVMAVEVTTLEPPGRWVPPVVTSMPAALATPVIVAGAELASVVELPHAPPHGIGPCGKRRHARLFLGRPEVAASSVSAENGFRPVCVPGVGRYGGCGNADTCKSDGGVARKQTLLARADEVIE
jgi:hypothetical protein